MHYSLGQQHITALRPISRHIAQRITRLFLKTRAYQYTLSCTRSRPHTCTTVLEEDSRPIKYALACMATCRASPCKRLDKRMNTDNCRRECGEGVMLQCWQCTNRPADQPISIEHNPCVITTETHLCLRGWLGQTVHQCIHAACAPTHMQSNREKRHEHMQSSMHPTHIDTRTAGSIR